MMETSLQPSLLEILMDSHTRVGTITYAAFKQVVLTAARLPKMILTPDEFIPIGEVYYSSVPASGEITVVLHPDDYAQFQKILEAVGVHNVTSPTPMHRIN